MKTRSQLFGGEFFFAFFIFMMILTIIFFMWSYTLREIRKSNDFVDMQETAVNIGEQLLRTPGNPENWTAANAISVGLSNESRNLVGDKILRFIDMMDQSKYDNSCAGNISNYYCSKYLLGVGKYDFHFQMTYLNGTVFQVYGRDAITGMEAVNETNIITVQRSALYESQIVRIVLTLWYGGPT
ncbi:MAG: hypothetical protein V1921_04700 [Candidatus Altiarchaeota archaeon]